MKDLTHKQAIQYIHLHMDGMLKENQQSLLDEHLRVCDSCRAYSDEMELLPSRLNHEFRTHWDKDFGPSQNVFKNVAVNARKIPMANRFFSNLRLLAGIAVLIALAFTINFVVSRLQSTSIASNNATSTPSSPVNLMIDPQSCKSAEQNSIPSELSGYKVLQNSTLVDGDFSFDFWLYCDPSLKREDQEHFSAVSGLGVYASWRYNGPSVEGINQDYFGFEPNVKAGTGWNGPLYQASENVKYGIDLSETLIREHIQQETSLQFRVMVNSPLGENGAVFSFHLQPTNAGIRVANLQGHSIHPVSEDLLAFSSTESGNSEIYTMRPDGSELTNLTNNSANDSNPLWSPDGERIAFESDRDGSYQIYRMDADGSNVTQLTSDKADHYLNINLDNKMNPWSPDGKKILFLANSGGDNWNLYAIGIDGQNQTLLASGTHYFMNVSWSPDGKHIAYVLDDSPNPNITFWPNIYVVDADGKNTKELKALIPQNEKLDLPFYWLSEDESILFVANQADRKHQSLYELNLLTGSLVQREILKSRVVDWQPEMALIFDAENALPTFIWQQTDGSSNTQQWNLQNCLIDFTRSSHGNLAFGGFCNDTNTFQLYWANPDGRASKQLLESHLQVGEMGEITWSPDDRYITFMLASDVQTRFYIVNVQDARKNPSMQPKEVTIGTDQIHAFPAWRPIP